MKEPLAIDLIPDVQPPPVREVPALLAAGDYQMVIRSLLFAVKRAIDGEDDVSLRDLAEWIDALPRPWDQAPEVKWARSWLHSLERRQTAALVLLEEVADYWTRELNGPRAEEARAALMAVLPTAGMIYASVGRMDLSRRVFSTALQWLPKGNGPLRAVRLLDVSSQEAERLLATDASGSVAFLLEALAFFQERNDKNGLARVAHNLGHQYLDRGDPAGARYWLERALELKQSQKGSMSRAYTLDSLGIVYQQLGMLAEAQAVLDQGLELSNRLGTTIMQAYALSDLGDVYRDRDDADTALELYRKALILKQQVRDTFGMARTQLSLSTLYRRRGQFALAADAAAEAQTLSHGLQNAAYRDMIELHVRIAGVMLGDEQAAQALEAVVHLLEQNHAWRWSALGHWYLALAADRVGSSKAVTAHLTAALDQGSRWRHLHLLALELPTTASNLRVAVEHAILPDAVAGLIHRATPVGLTALLQQVPAAAALVAAAGRVAEAQSMDLQLLGTFRVVQAGREVDLSAARSQKAISLFKLLAAHRGRPTAREQILDAIWPEADPEAGDRTLEVTLSALRKLLDPPGGPSVILRRGRGYLLNPAVPLEVDVDRFTRHLEKGNWWWQRRQEGSALSEWLLAEAAYGGDFLADDLYEDWAIDEREGLREQYLELLLRMGEAMLAEGRLDETVLRANRVLAADPIRETAYRLLMRAHARRGDRAVALRTFRRCAEVLRRELGEEPMPETRDLARQIRAGDSV
ncbi:MAG: BTAD domain-containing putative transcriptional regulator [Mycobacterium leprae]